jgi:hypothetical protein
METQAQLEITNKEDVEFLDWLTGQIDDLYQVWKA